jgi:DNA-binding transcriptional LysR family regulator
MCINAQPWILPMKWDDLKIVLAVSRSGTMSGAAKLLNVQHSTVSRRVKALERQIGTNLVRRNKGSYKLTRAGLKIRNAAIRVEKEIASVDGTLLKDDDPLKGVLRVTTINSLASTVLMPMFGAFSRAHPQIELHVMVSSDTANLTNREADVAIRLSNAPPDTLVGKRVATIASTVYGSAAYLDELEAEKSDPEWLGVSCCGFHEGWTKEASSSEKHAFNSDEALLTVSALREGLGISYLACHIGDAEPTLRRYCEPESRHDLDMWVLIHPESRTNNRVMTFRDFMVREIQAQQHHLAALSSPAVNG